MQKLRLGGSTFSMMWTSTALDAMRDLRTVGLREFDVIASPGHLWPSELSPATRRELAAMLRAEDLRIESVNLPALDFNLASSTPEVRAFFAESYGSALELSAELGGTGVVVVPGRASALFPPPLESSLDWLRDGLERLLSVAESTGQKLFVETHPLTGIPTAAATADFIGSIGHPALSVAYDVANAEFIGEGQTDAIRLLAPILGQVHLSDATRTSWRHDRAGTGTVDFEAVTAVLDEIGFCGLAVVEVISPQPRPDIEATVTRLLRANHKKHSTTD